MTLQIVDILLVECACLLRFKLKILQRLNYLSKTMLSKIENRRLYKAVDKNTDAVSA